MKTFTLRNFIILSLSLTVTYIIKMYFYFLFGTFTFGFIFVIGFISYILNNLIKITVILFSEEMFPIIGNINKEKIKSLENSFLLKKDDSITDNNISDNKKEDNNPSSENISDNPKSISSNLTGYDNKEVVHLYSLSIQELREIKDQLTRTIMEAKEEEYGRLLSKQDTIDEIIDKKLDDSDDNKSVSSNNDSSYNNTTNYIPNANKMKSWQELIEESNDLYKKYHQLKEELLEQGLSEPDIKEILKEYKEQSQILEQEAVRLKREEAEQNNSSNNNNNSNNNYNNNSGKNKGGPALFDDNSNCKPQ